MLKLVTATLTSKGRITLPQPVRQQLQVQGRKGEYVSFVIDESARQIIVIGRRKSR